MFQIITNNSFTFARHFEIVRFLAHRFENYLEHIFISRYVVVGCVINAVAGIEFFVIDEAKYFISYPLPFVVPADVGFSPALANPQCCNYKVEENSIRQFSELH